MISPWKDDEQGKTPSLPSAWLSKDYSGSMKKAAKIGIPILVVLILALGYYIFTRSAAANVTFEFSKPDQIRAGEPFTINVSFSNYSDQVLKDATLSLMVPEGISFVSGVEGQRVMEQSIGDLGPGSMNQESFDLIAIRDTQTIKHIGVKLEYQTGRSSGKFENQSGVDLPIGESSAPLAFEVPEHVFSGTDFTLTVHYRNNGNRDLRNFKVKLDYPPVFQFVKSDKEVSVGNSQWNIGTLAKGEEDAITVTGHLIGQDDSYYNFHGVVTADFSGRTYTISEQNASIGIEGSPLSVVPTVNGESDYVAHIGDTVTYELRYKNNSKTTLQGVTVKATLSGELFDFSTAKTNASFNAFTRTFTWLAANTPELASLAPGQEGSVKIDLKLKDAFPIKRISDKNYALNLRAEIQSPTVPEGTQAAKTVSIAELQTRVAGMVKLRAKALWRDAQSGIVNKGPYPPRVNKPTQYTIHWIVSNYATDVSDVEVGGFLQSGARWTGVVKSTIDAKPEYDASTGKVIWKIGNIAATKGVVSAPLEAIFQIEVTPASNQINQYVTFLARTELKGLDTFTDTQLGDSVQELTTALPDDTSISQSVNRVVQP